MNISTDVQPGQVIYMDNFFTSVKLFSDLHATLEPVELFDQIGLAILHNWQISKKEQQKEYCKSYHQCVCIRKMHIYLLLGSTCMIRDLFACYQVSMVTMSH